MGIGSPRLLKFLRCGSAIALAALWAAPSAFADDGSLISAAVTAAPVQAAATVPQVSTEAMPSAPNLVLTTPPAVETQEPVATVQRAAADVAAPIAPALPQATRDARPTPRSPVDPRRPSFPEASAPAIHSEHRGEPQSSRRRGHEPLPQGAGHRAGADAPRPFVRHVAAVSTATNARVTTNATTGPRAQMRAPNRRAPLPGPSGLSGAAGTTTSSGVALLLFALAVASGFVRIPRVGRVLEPCVECAHAYDDLLRLERPD